MATVVIRKPKKRGDKKNEDTKIYGVYMKSVLDRKICLSITEIGKNVKSNLETKLNASSMKSRMGEALESLGGCPLSGTSVLTWR